MHQWKGLHEYNTMETKKIEKSSKFEFWLVTKSWNHLSFVNIGRTLAIDTSMERSSRVLQHRNPNIWFFFSKSSKLNFTNSEAIAGLCSYPKYLMLYISRFVSTSSTNLLKAFYKFRICFRIIGRKQKKFQCITRLGLCKRGEGGICADQHAF